MAVNPKILVIDDDQMITNSLKRVLAYEGFAVETAMNGEDGLRQFNEWQPDLIVLDVTLPGVSGLEICRHMKSLSAIPVLFLSARDEVSDRVAGLEGGGDDYLVKPFAYEELIARIRVLLRRNPALKTVLLQFAGLTLNTAKKCAVRDGREIELSATEYQLLFYLMSNPDRILSKEQILEWVWGYDFGGDSNIIEVYIRYLRNKLEQDGETRLIHTVRGMGYILKV